MGSISLFIFFITLLVLARQVGPNIIILMVSLSACCLAVMGHLYCACFISLNLLYFWIRDIYCSWHFWLGMIKSTLLLAWHQCENHPSIRFTFSLPLAYKFDSQSGQERWICFVYLYISSSAFKLLSTTAQRNSQHCCWHLSRYTRLLPPSSRQKPLLGTILRGKESKWLSLFCVSASVPGKTWPAQKFRVERVDTPKRQRVASTASVMRAAVAKKPCMLSK